jgi:serine/threonine protein kinase
LGAGAYGKVYQGLGISNGQLLAIKNISVSVNSNNLNPKSTINGKYANFEL